MRLDRSSVVSGDCRNGRKNNAEVLEQALGCNAVFHSVCHCDAAHLAYASIVKRARSVGEVFLQAPSVATVEKNHQTRAQQIISFTRRSTERLVRTFLSASNADASALIRVLTSASEVIEESILEPKYLNFFAESTKPTAEPSALRMSKRDVSAVE